MKLKPLILLSALLSSMSIASLRAEEEAPREQRETPESSMFELIESLNMRTVPDYYEPWSTNTFKEYLERYLHEQLEPKEYPKRRLAFNLARHHRAVIKPSDQPCDPSTWQDLVIFCGERNSPKEFIAGKLDRTKTENGKIAWYQLLSAITTNTNELKRRQNVVRELLGQPQLLEKARAALQACAASENCLLSFFETPDSFLNDVRELLLYRHGGDTLRLNQNDLALTLLRYFNHWQNVYSLVFSIAAGGVLTTYGTACLLGLESREKMEYTASTYRGNPLTNWLWYLRANTNTKRAIHAGLALSGGIISLLSVPNQLRWLRNCLFLEQIIYRKCVILSQFATALRQLAQLISENPVLEKLVPELSALRSLFNQELNPDEINDFMELMEDDLFQRERAIVLQRGKMIRGYKLFHDIKEKLVPALQATALLDAYCGAAQLMTEEGSHFCFVSYDETKAAPHISLENFFNPLLAPEKAVKNSFTAGNSTPLTSILTGPNAGGKSTLLKAVGINVLLAQSIGIAAANRMTLTPFSYIATYLNITDDLANGNSLFKAEVLRTLALVDRVEKTEPGKFNFIIFDEMFNGTTPAEGAAAAYSVTQHLAGFGNTVAIVATHFGLLTELEATDHSRFRNYRVSVSLQPDGSITYPFRLEEGVSMQHVALDILRNEGFTGPILEQATRMVR